MGITQITAKVSDLMQRGSPYEGEFLVDTAAIDCMAPRADLLKAGVKVEGKKTYELASGDEVEYEYGFARVSFLGEETVAQVIFGPSGCEPLLGVVALENTGFIVDPVNQTLRRLDALPLK